MMRLCTLFFVATPALAVPAISVAPRAEVSRSTIRLGDVAKLRGFAKDARARFAKIELGKAPIVGTGKLLPRAFLLSRIRGAGVPPGVRLKLPRRLEVTRKALVLRGSEIRTRIANAIRRKMPHADGDVAGLVVPRVPDLKVPHGLVLVGMVYGSLGTGMDIDTARLRLARPCVLQQPIASLHKRPANLESSIHTCFLR